MDATSASICVLYYAWRNGCLPETEESVLHAIRPHEVTLTTTHIPWVFRPGDFFTKDRVDFVITHVGRPWWPPFRRRDFIVYGKPVPLR